FMRPRAAGRIRRWSRSPLRTAAQTSIVRSRNSRIRPSESTATTAKPIWTAPRPAWTRGRSMNKKEDAAPSTAKTAAPTTPSVALESQDIPVIVDSLVIEDGLQQRIGGAQSLLGVGVALLLGEQHLIEFGDLCDRLG